VSQVANVGDYFTLEMFGEPLVVVRGRTGSACCRACACIAGRRSWPARAMPGSSPARSTNGATRSTASSWVRPSWSRRRDSSPKECRLPEIRSEIVEPLGLIFITFSEQPSSISDRLKDLSEHMAPANMADMVVCQTREIENTYNWKILIETFMECYHHIGAHRDTLEPNFPARLSYVEDAKQGWSLCHSPLREDIVHEAYMDDEKRPFSLYLVYPLMLMGSSMDVERSDRLGFITITPVGPNRVISKRHTLVRRDAIGTTELAEMLERQRERGAKINKEDNEVNDMQQLGASSMFAPVGRLSHLEGSVWHLAEYVRQRLAAN
jgi:phenylpropionate dioxygenase-like ring-hydroxylating dioxygenase large terminal subunit